MLKPIDSSLHSESEITENYDVIYNLSEKTLDSIFSMNKKKKAILIYNGSNYNGRKSCGQTSFLRLHNENPILEEGETDRTRLMSNKLLFRINPHNFSTIIRIHSRVQTSVSFIAQIRKLGAWVSTIFGTLLAKRSWHLFEN